jgi:hypothetical protein
MKVLLVILDRWVETVAIIFTAGMMFMLIQHPEDWNKPSSIGIHISSKPIECKASG